MSAARETIAARRKRPGSRRRLEEQIRTLQAQLAETQLALHRAEEELGWEQGVSAVLQDLYRPLIAAESSSRQTARIVLDKARQLTGSACGFISEAEANNGAPRQRLVVAEPDDDRSGAQETDRRLLKVASAPGRELLERALSTGEAFYANTPPDVTIDLAGGRIALRRFLAVPVKLDGKAVGQLAVANAGRDYIERDLRLVKYLARFYAMALQHKRSQERLYATLREKEVLLREIHHRVKNNLQVISSLLSLQAASLTDPHALEMLKESQTRVRSMALVHDQLHRSPDLSRIGFREYVKNLCASLFSSYGVDSARIALRVDVDDIALPIDAAIPCGLIVHELVSNCLKHAFPGGRPGQIFIQLKAHPPQGMILTVADDGIGLPENVDVATATSLGLRLVRILAAQIEAAVRHRSGAGTVFEVELPQRGGEQDYTDESTEDIDRRR